MSTPLILVSNDDGIQVGGLRAFCDAILPPEEVMVMTFGKVNITPLHCDLTNPNYFDDLAPLELLQP